MHHARAHHFYPFIFELFRDVFTYEPSINLYARFDEWEETGTESNFDLRSFENMSVKMLERAFEIRERIIFADCKSLELPELRLMRHVGRFVAKCPAGNNYAIRRLNALFHLRLHIAHLHGRGMRAEDMLWHVFDEKCVLHVARRMVFGNIQGVKIMPFVLNEWPFSEGKTHPVEDTVCLA